jgi:NADH-quinone oxidoreductase subunit F
MDACEDDAILGKKKFVHVIDQDECTICGKCMEACDEDAIVMAGAVKPRCPTKPIPCKKK